MTLYLANHRTASIRMVARWHFGCRKFATCYIVQVGPVWLSIDRKRKSSNDKLRDGAPDTPPAN